MATPRLFPGGHQASRSYGKMDKTCGSKQNGGDSNLSRFVLLLFLAGLQPALCSDGAQPVLDGGHNEGVKVSVIAPDYVTVGVPSSVGCEANCTQCTYSVSVDGQTSARGQGRALAFTLRSWVETLTVTCTATAEERKLTATATKRVQVLAGPANVSIAGPDSMNPAVGHTYSCHAHCRPSCTYAWKTDSGPWIGSPGNVISITPREMEKSKLLICKATNSVSGLFVTAVRNITVISGPSEIQIQGPDIIETAVKYKFVCAAACWPSCRYVSSVDSSTVRGQAIELTADGLLRHVTLRCDAQNTASKETGTAFKTVQIIGSGRSDRSASARPEETSALLTLAFMISATILL